MCHRQPEREERRKRGASIDPPGHDAGKKIKGKKRHILVDTLGLLLNTVFGRPPFLAKDFENLNRTALAPASKAAAFGENVVASPSTAAHFQAATIVR